MNDTTERLARAWLAMDKASREIHAASKARSPWANGQWRPSQRYEAAAKAHREARLRWESLTAGMSCKDQNAIIDAALAL